MKGKGKGEIKAQIKQRGGRARKKKSEFTTTVQTRVLRRINAIMYSTVLANMTGLMILKNPKNNAAQSYNLA